MSGPAEVFVVYDLRTFGSYCITPRQLAAMAAEAVYQRQIEEEARRLAFVEEDSLTLGESRAERRRRLRAARKGIL